MKYKRIIAVILMLSMCRTVAFAKARRIKPSRGNTADANANVLMLEDFTEVGEGVLPANVSGNRITTQKYMVGKNKNKNCLIIKDDIADSTYAGASAIVELGEFTGIVGVETRFKLLQLGDKPWNAFGASFFGPEGAAGKVFSGYSVRSADGGITGRNNGGDNPTLVTPITLDNWYTVKYILDFGAQTGDMKLLDEGTGKVYDAMGLTFDRETKSLNSMALSASMYGGIWVYDYIKITTEKSGLESGTVQKGCTPILMETPKAEASSERININYNGSFKYTTEKPYLKDGEVMVTAKSIADILGLKLRMESGVCTFSKNDENLVFKTENSDPSLRIEIRNNKYFVPANAFEKLADCSITFKQEENTLYISNNNTATEVVE